MFGYKQEVNFLAPAFNKSLVSLSSCRLTISYELISFTLISLEPRREGGGGEWERAARRFIQDYFIQNILWLKLLQCVSNKVTVQ